MSAFKLFEAILHTDEETVEKAKAEWPEVSDEEAQNYQKLYKLMDGQKALVMPSFYAKDEYIYIGLLDQQQDKEVHWLMEQDPFMGCFINDREGFDKAWDSEDYSQDGSFCLKKEQVEIVRELKGGEKKDGEKV